MSISPGFQPSSSGTGGISDVVSQDDLTRFAQIAGVLRYLTAPLDPPPPPDTATSIAPGAMQAVFRSTYAGLAQAGVDNALAHKLAAQWGAFAGSVGHIVAALVQMFAMALEPVAAIVLGALDGLRKGFDPQLGDLGALVLNELLGTDYGDQNMAHGLGVGDHLSRARSVGALLYNQLESEFAPGGGGQLVPTSQPAETFTGLAINFGMASSIMGALGTCVPILHLDELRELGEDVATNIGLGRLVRRALTPLIQILVAQPLTWALNTKYLPTQFKEADLVNPYLGTQLNQAQLYNAMHLLGYSDDKIQAFIEMHQKRLTPADVALLVNNALWAQPDAEKYLDRAGWPTNMSGTLFSLEDLHEQRGWYDKLIAEMETEVKEGRLTIDEFESVLRGTATTSTIGTPGAGGVTLPTLKGLPFSDGVKDVIMATVQYKVKAAAHTRPEKLSGGELFYAFAGGLLTDSEVRDYWTARGLPAQDQDIRMLLWLQHLNRLHQLEQAKLTAYQEKQKVFLEKQGGTKPGPVPPIPPVPPFPLG